MTRTFKEELYAINRGYTLADNIDRAWVMYHSPDQSLDGIRDRETAQEFLIYAFNLTSLENLNEQLLDLMFKRNSYKHYNPDYIPGIRPNHLQLDPAALSIDRTPVSLQSSNPILQALFDKKELLDVNAGDKQSDLLLGTKFFSSQQRASQRVHLYQGKFYQMGQLVSTTGYTSHNKPGYAAFTLNANGELSVFNQIGMTNAIAHSSMNAGSPVVCAGELAIRNGELKGITTYSGHYAPSLFNIYRTLEHFKSKGIPIDNAQVYTFQHPSIAGLNTSSKKAVNSMSDFYVTTASELYTDMKNQLHNSLLQIQEVTTQYQEHSFKTMCYEIKDWFLKSTLTSDRKLIAVETANSAAQLLEQLVNVDVENAPKLDRFIDRLVEQRAMNDRVSVLHGKAPGNGRLDKTLDTFIQQARAIQQLAGHASAMEEFRMKLVC